MVAADAGILFPADPAGVVAVGVAAPVVANPASMVVAGLADAGILFPADPVGTLSLTDQDGTLSPTLLGYCSRSTVLSLST